MQKILTPAITLLISCFLFAGCNFSKGTNKDLRTGLSYSYNGFRVQEVALVNADNKAMTDNKVKMDSKVSIVAIGLENYELKNGKAFPGISLLMTDKSGKQILYLKDMLKSEQGYSPADASQLTGSVTTGTPMVPGETYNVKVHFWDKLKPETQLNAEVDIVVE